MLAAGKNPDLVGEDLKLCAATSNRRARAFNPPRQILESGGIKFQASQRQPRQRALRDAAPRREGAASWSPTSADTRFPVRRQSRATIRWGRGRLSVPRLHWRRSGCPYPAQLQFTSGSSDYNLKMLRKAALFVVSLALASAAVTRVEIASRADLPQANHERVTGKVYFAVDPKLKANQIITDIALAPRNDKGWWSFSGAL